MCAFQTKTGHNKRLLHTETNKFYGIVKGLWLLLGS